MKSTKWEDDTFRGRAIAIVQPNGENGKIEISVSAEGLSSSRLTIDVSKIN